MSRKVKHFILELANTTAPLSSYDRIKFEMKAFSEVYPEFSFEVTRNEFPYVIKIINNLTGEIRWAVARKMVDPITVQYKFNGKTLTSDSLYDEILKEMYL